MLDVIVQEVDKARGRIGLKLVAKHENGSLVQPEELIERAKNAPPRPPEEERPRGGDRGAAAAAAARAARNLECLAPSGCQALPSRLRRLSQRGPALPSDRPRLRRRRDPHRRSACVAIGASVARGVRHPLGAARRRARRCRPDPARPRPVEPHPPPPRAGVDARPGRTRPTTRRGAPHSSPASRARSAWRRWRCSRSSPARAGGGSWPACCSPSACLRSCPGSSCAARERSEGVRL